MSAREQGLLKESAAKKQGAISYHQAQKERQEHIKKEMSTAKVSHTPSNKAKLYKYSGTKKVSNDIKKQKEKQEQQRIATNNAKHITEEIKKGGSKGVSGAKNEDEITGWSSPKEKKKVQAAKSKSEIRQNKVKAYEELIDRDKRAQQYRRDKQNQKRMSPEERSIDNWMAQNFNTYKETEAKIQQNAKKLKKAWADNPAMQYLANPKNPNRTDHTAKEMGKKVNKLKDIHTLQVDERNTIHKALGLSTAMSAQDVGKAAAKHKSPNFKGKTPSRETQYKAGIRRMNEDYLKGKSYTETRMPYAPSKAKPDKNATTGARPNSTTKGYSGSTNDMRDWNITTTIPKPEPPKQTEKKPAKSTNKGGKNGGNYSPKGRTPEQLVNDIAGIKSSKGKSGATHKEGTKADYKSREEYEKYYKQQDKLKGGKK